MGKTKIQWATHSWNVTHGCSNVSAGCWNCYARKMARRMAGRFGYPPAPDYFKPTIREDRLQEPYSWKKPRVVFVSSMGDLFHEDIPADFITQVFDVMADTPNHIYMVLTKRPERMLNVLFGQEGFWYLGGGDYIPNVWLGVTTENQSMAESRIQWLLKATGFKKFISAEPLLGDISLYQVPMRQWGCDGKHQHPHKHEDGTSGNIPHHHHDEYCEPPINLVIAGGETGTGAREMKWEWASHLMGQCGNAGIPFFFKQMGDNFNEDKAADVLGARKAITDRQLPEELKACLEK